MNTDSTTSSTPKASVLRQLAALFYDGLLLLAIVLVALIPVTLITSQGQLPRNHPVFQIYLSGICFLYFAWFWTRNGKTLGMRVWHIKIQRMDGELISWSQALLRFLTAIPTWFILFLSLLIHYAPLKTLPEWSAGASAGPLFMIGMVMLVIDHWPNGWRDRLTKTAIVRSDSRLT
ncbi:MAG: RDD family protein [Gammaproteobacteria bacterium]|nr:RDD family protein [Gammaproteobacteria bacterium]MDH5650923.1 RDD family protein [Gammaproteobacteria bacterium]